MQRLAVSNSSGWPIAIAVLVSGLKTDNITIMSWPSGPMPRERAILAR